MSVHFHFFSVAFSIPPPFFFSRRGWGKRGRGVAVGTLAKGEQFAAVVCAFTFPIMIKRYFLSDISTIIRDLVVTYAYLCKFISFLPTSVSSLISPLHHNLFGGILLQSAIWKGSEVLCEMFTK